jgi:hypothetical protein
MINQEQPEDIEDFILLGSLIRNNENHVKVNPGLPWQNHYLKRRILVRQRIGFI